MNRTAVIVVGIIVTLLGGLFGLQGIGVIGGSVMSHTTVWSVLGPIIALIGLALVVIGARLPRRTQFDR